MFRTLISISSLCCLLACEGDYAIYGKGDTVYVEVPVEVEVEVEVEVPTGEPQGDVWVESFIQPLTSNGTDILWVIDFSCSMNDDAQRIVTGIDMMMGALPSSGWRLNILSADQDDALVESQFPLVPGDTAIQAMSMYNTISHGMQESGLGAVYNYIENNPWSQEWMRYDATLLVVFVTDERDSSFITESDFILWYEDLRPGSGFVAGITSSFDNNGYEQVVDYFNGVMIDILDPDWSLGMSDATQQILPYEEWVLEYIPVLDSIVVFIDGEQDDHITWYYDLSANRIRFSLVPLPGSLVEIAYILNEIAN